MSSGRRLIVFLASTVLFSSRAWAQSTCPQGSTCVSPQEMKVFVQLLKDEKCRNETLPKVTEDPVAIIVDRQGRVYGSGNEPMPHKLHIDWCNYQLDAAGGVQLQVAERVEPTWGFRFRPKAALGYLPVEAIAEKDASKGIDGGILLEPFFIQSINLNAYVGVRSVGGGVGMDLTKNFGVYAGYSVAWWSSWRSNLLGAVYFSFW